MFDFSSTPLQHKNSLRDGHDSIGCSESEDEILNYTNQNDSYDDCMSEEEIDMVMAPHGRFLRDRGNPTTPPSGKNLSISVVPPAPITPTKVHFRGTPKAGRDDPTSMTREQLTPRSADIVSAAAAATVVMEPPATRTEKPTSTTSKPAATSAKKPLPAIIKKKSTTAAAPQQLTRDSSDDTVETGGSSSTDAAMATLVDCLRELTDRNPHMADLILTASEVAEEHNQKEFSEFLEPKKTKKNSVQAKAPRRFFGVLRSNNKKSSETKRFLFGKS